MFLASDVIIATPKCGKWHFRAKKVLGYLQSVSPKYALSLILYWTCSSPRP